VVRAKQNFQFRRRSSQTVDRLTGLRSDQTVSLTGPLSRKLYPIPLRRVSYYSEQTDQSLVFLTNNFSIAPLTVAAIYRYRWQIELFFKWIKQHLRIKRFLGTSPNSVKSQIWIAVAVYVLIAIIKKKLGLQQNLYTILQVLSLTLFEKNSILSLFENSDDTEKILNPGNQLFLFQN
jgi:IS4 transposase